LWSLPNHEVAYPFAFRVVPMVPFSIGMIESAALPHGRRELVSVYLDTKDRDFRRRGLSFRLRRKDGRLLKTIKGTYRVS
jgi:hypothetical protein